jgi:hypothetical protein
MTARGKGFSSRTWQAASLEASRLWRAEHGEDEWRALLRKHNDATTAPCAPVDYNDAGPWGRYDRNRVITTRPFWELLEEVAAEDGVPIGPHLERARFG